MRIPRRSRSVVWRRLSVRRRPVSLPVGPEPYLSIQWPDFTLFW